MHAEQPAERAGVDQVGQQQGGDEQVGPDEVCRARAPAHEQRGADDQGHEGQRAQGDEGGIPVGLEDGDGDEDGLGHEGDDDERQHG
ncbi:hypothetical protein [Ornithinimicrobium sp. W1665]|uniref:hypothetical protein n=1 Tax=Ornithinimicrobium sp. W1665 TaxID=3416666 RepID=UPI003CF15263